MAAVESLKAEPRGFVSALRRFGDAHNACAYRLRRGRALVCFSLAAALFAPDEKQYDRSDDVERALDHRRTS